LVQFILLPKTPKPHIRGMRLIDDEKLLRK